MAMGPIPWVLISEIFPGPIRGRAVAVGVGAIWAACLAVAQSFPGAERAARAERDVLDLRGLLAAQPALRLALVPETKGRRLEDIAASWSAR